MSLLAIAVAGGTALYLGRNHLHIQIGCETCSQQVSGQVSSEQAFLSAGLRTGPDQLYVLQITRREASQSAQSTATQAVMGDGLAAPSSSFSSNFGSGSAPNPAKAPFRDGVNLAMAAANQTQTAQSSVEWAEVAWQWQQAIAHMQAVPSGHPRYELAQQKVEEYSYNLDYAKQNAGIAWAHQEHDLPQTPLRKKEQNQATESLTAPSSRQTSEGSPLQWSSESPAGVRLLLTLGASSGLGIAALFSIRRSNKRGKAQEVAMQPIPSSTHPPFLWRPILSHALNTLAVLRIIRPFSPSKRVYKMTATACAHQLQRRLYLRLLSLTKDQSVTLQLIKENLKQHPEQSANWCCEQAISSLETQRAQKKQHRKQRRRTLYQRPETSPTADELPIIDELPGLNELIEELRS